MLRPILLLSSVLGISVLTAFAGCSSTTNNVAASDGGGTDTGVSHKDSGGSSGGDSSSGDDGGGGDGGTCSANVAFTYPGYVTIVPKQACTAADLKAFETACTVAAATAATCNGWQASNLPGSDGGPGGTTCGNCIFGPYNPPTNFGQGAAYVTCDSTVPTSSTTSVCLFSPNVIGCVQLIDPTNGPACAAADDALSQCDAWECNLCSDTASGGPLDQACVTAVNAAQCATFLTKAQSACATDFGDGGAGTAFSKCSPSGGTNQSEDFSFIIAQMCGGGTTDAGGDSGPTDSGAGG